MASPNLSGASANGTGSVGSAATQPTDIKAINFIAISFKFRHALFLFIFIFLIIKRIHVSDFSEN